MVSAIRLEGVSTEKNCVEQFLTKQKTNIWKARESKTRGLGEQQLLCKQQLLNSLKHKKMSSKLVIF